jgi:hypothetical protein
MNLKVFEFDALHRNEETNEVEGEDESTANENYNSSQKAIK